MHYAKMKFIVRFATCFTLTVIAVGFPAELNGDLAANIIDSERQKEALVYLLQFGYISKSSKDVDAISTTPEEETIKEFQKMAGLTQTGKLDDDTMMMMRKPRCGMKDKEEEEGITGSRKRRYALRGKWNKTSLSYKITVYPESLLKEAVDKEIARAFQAWSAVTSMKFTQEESGTTDIVIQFRGGAHGDSQRFMGRGKKLAHAWYPGTTYPGLVCYDSAEEWTIDTDRGQNLFVVAVHEFGHTLGLEHNWEDEEAVMWPWTPPYNPNFDLGTDDIAGIQELYVTLVKSDDENKVNKEVFPGRDFHGDRHGKVGIILIDHNDGWVVVWWRDTRRREDHSVGANEKFELAYTGAQKQCTEQRPCPIMGHMTPWSTWSPYSATCGLAHRTRNRQCNQDTLPNARTCGEINHDMEQIHHMGQCPS